MLITIIQQNGVSVKNKFAKNVAMLYAKKIVVLVVCIFSLQLLSAQSKYITHTLKQGESLSMLAKQYNTSVGDIMRMNGMHADTKLVYGSEIKIPSVKGEVPTATKKETTEVVKNQPSSTTGNEITHVVMKGETLYSISKKYNVSVDQLKAWNHLADNNAKVGTLLAISDNGVNKIAATPSQKQRVETTTASTQQTNAPAVSNEPVAKTEPANTNVETTKADDQTMPTQQPTQTENNVANVAPSTSTDYTGTGYFADQFKDKKANQNISGVSKTFKTASGWSDGKFYILANDIEPGTIVKITADNGNAVYAKVLWNLGDLKENSGISFRVSNATAAALRENTESFKVNVSF